MADPYNYRSYRNRDRESTTNAESVDTSLIRNEPTRPQTSSRRNRQPRTAGQDQQGTVRGRAAVHIESPRHEPRTANIDLEESYLARASLFVVNDQQRVNAEQSDEIAELRDKNAEKDTIIEELKSENQGLKEKLNKSQRSKKELRNKLNVFKTSNKARQTHGLNNNADTNANLLRGLGSMVFLTIGYVFFGLGQRGRLQIGNPK